MNTPGDYDRETFRNRHAMTLHCEERHDVVRDREVEL